MRIGGYDGEGRAVAEGGEPVCRITIRPVIGSDPFEQLPRELHRALDALEEIDAHGYIDWPHQYAEILLPPQDCDFAVAALRRIGIRATKS
jgi:hypothetical protein